MRDGIVAPIALGVGRITKKDACEGSRSKLMWCYGSDARIAKAPEDVKTIIRWGSAVEKTM